MTNIFGWILKIISLLLIAYGGILLLLAVLGAMHMNPNDMAGLGFLFGPVLLIPGIALYYVSSLLLKK